MFICILGGIGTAGVPAGSIPVIAMILGMIGVPPDGIGIILGVDRVLDMCRTTRERHRRPRRGGGRLRRRA